MGTEKEDIYAKNVLGFTNRSVFAYKLFSVCC